LNIFIQGVSGGIDTKCDIVGFCQEKQMTAQKSVDGEGRGGDENDRRLAKTVCDF
jgi:uncharacterized hydantoinase/oxoprolinase family protein